MVACGNEGKERSLATNITQPSVNIPANGTNHPP
eukprot:CAMPEP_0113690090 /NCGR_PEP_ID=MMETSP0038_2-20120614/17570_1 /TAXON_ID=2898 /ORGANISM="Cryptomonas paramecium" /LENGTH=33 /DNA_ID=CAMNT_0000611321 /DNA_START=155 /DNA_END=253 /DNA_ORIENTATION=+ /assembly_acc=CAM_ASM_000170